eukprot:GILK01004743.1.p1 GENE.GILK01004743.1~~GILK01004743.1.p1  ORF type:complete len:375 (+),score=45.94 GILK01004743.1:66-1127(+)
MDSSVAVVIKNAGSNFHDTSFNFPLSMTVAQVKQFLSVNYETQPAAVDQRIVFAGRLLIDEESLESIFSQRDLSHPQVLHLMLRNAPKPPQKSPSPSPVQELSSSSLPSSTPSSSPSLSPSGSPFTPGTSFTPPSSYAFAPFSPGTPTFTPPSFSPMTAQQFAFLQSHYNMQYMAAMSNYSMWLQMQAAGGAFSPSSSPPNGPVPPQHAVPQRNEAPRDDMLGEEERPQGLMMHVKLISRLLLLLFLLGQDASYSRLAVLVVGACFIYLYQVGVLAWLTNHQPDNRHVHPQAVINQNLNNLNNNDNGDPSQTETVEARSASGPSNGSSILRVVSDFCSGFVSSLLPSWRPPVV